MNSALYYDQFMSCSSRTVRTKRQSMKTEHLKQRKTIVFSVTPHLMHEISMSMEDHQRSIRVRNVPASITTHQLHSKSHTACRSSTSQKQSSSKLPRLRNYTNFTLETSQSPCLLKTLRRTALSKPTMATPPTP